MDRDMWDQIERVLQRTCAVGRVEVVKVTAHQDTKEQKDGTKKRWGNITLHEWGNVRADAVVGDMAQEDMTVEWDLRDGWKWATAGTKLNGPTCAWIGWGGRDCTGALAEEITEHVQMQIYQRYLEKWNPETLNGNGAKWLSMRDWTRGQHLNGAWWGPRKARRGLQMIHGWLPTRSALAKREYPGTTGERCPHCKVKETTWHALGQCKHPASCQARDKSRAALDICIEEGAPDDNAKDWLRWIYWTRHGTWCREGAPHPPGGAGPERGERDADAVLAANVSDLGGQQIWAGVIPSGLHGRLVVKGGMSEDKASKLIAKLSKLARMASREVWQARCKWINENGTNAETRNAWRTAVRRVAQNHFMAVGSLAAAKSMANPQFEAWRQKVVRHVATGPVDKHNSSYWEELISKETDKEMDEILREREQAKEMGCARPCKLTKRQQRTAAQAASDAAERAEAALRRVEKGWRAPRLGGPRWACGTLSAGRIGLRG